MSQIIVPVHPQTPEQRNIEIIVRELRRAAVMLYPTDTGIALGCMLNNKNGIERIRHIRKLPEGQSMTFICASLSNIAEYARVSNPAYRLLKSLIPGPYTFILPATKQVPHYAHDPKRKTVGIRVPNAAVANAILHTLDEPLISITAKDEEGNEFSSMEEAVNSIGHQVDLSVILQSFSWMEEAEQIPSTIVDMTTDEFSILREGANVEVVKECIGERAGV